MDFLTGKLALIGNRGKGIRSDCHITLELTERDGIQLELISKVESMYGDDIRKLLREILTFYGIEHARLLVEDSGAITPVIAARMEAAIRQLKNSEAEYLLPLLSENLYQTDRERNRISRLYLPGNTPSLMINAGIHKPDGIILDLEDAVAPNKKYEARFVVRNALRNIDFYGAERMVRINQVPAGLQDLEYLVPHNVNLLLVPKCESADQIRLVNEKIRELQTK